MTVSNLQDTTESFATTDEPNVDADITMPLGTGGFADAAAPDPLAGAGASRKLNSSALLIVLILAVAGVGLFSMRTLTRMTQGAEADIQVEKKVNEFLNGKADVDGLISIEKNDLLKALRQDRTEQQVRLEDVQKDPFDLVADSAMPSDIPADADPAVARREARRAEIQKVAARLKLKSVIMGRDPLANIEGRIVRQQEVISIEPEMLNFHVARITPESVTLRVEDPELGLNEEIELTLKQD
jgi:hypothetical protein